MTELAAYLEHAQAAVDRAAGLVRTQRPGHLTPKGERDYASEVDFAVERAVREQLLGATPTIGFVGEEEGSAGDQGDTWWTLDPIDGTVNFTHGLPLCGVSLALVRDGQPVIGVIDLPFLGSRYWAVAGGGARHNGQQIHTRDVSRLEDALVSIGDYAVGAGAAEKNRIRLALTERLAGRVLRIRMFGSAAIDLAWLAAGRTHASVTLSNNSWDMAAGVAIAREAGARVVDHDGTEHTAESSAVCASGPGVCDELVDLVFGVTSEIRARPSA
jgi:myo-inositol-1(or 4)-monophosphatase